MSELPTCFMDVPLRFWAKIEVDHVRRCVNPDHLRPVSDRENTLAEGSLSLAAIRAAQTHCSRGHRLADPNLVPSEVARGLRNCLACNRATATVRHAKKSGRVLDVQTVADERYRAITEQGTTA